MLAGVYFMESRGRHSECKAYTLGLYSILRIVRGVYVFSPRFRIAFVVRRNNWQIFEPCRDEDEENTSALSLYTNADSILARVRVRL